MLDEKVLEQKLGLVNLCFILNVLCGMRSQNEFAYGGDASVKRPELNKEVSDKEWDDFVYNRKSLRGKHLELWHHVSGCRQWFKLKRYCNS